MKNLPVERRRQLYQQRAGKSKRPGSGMWGLGGSAVLGATDAVFDGIWD